MLSQQSSIRFLASSGPAFSSGNHDCEEVVNESVGMSDDRPRLNIENLHSTCQMQRLSASFISNGFDVDGNARLDVD